MYQKKTGVSSMAIILIFVYVSCFSGCSFFIETSGKVPITSVSVIDGDTIKAKVDGKIETIRLLLVDTPETKHPSLGKQPLGEDAKHFTRDQITKATNIELEYDQSERDKYGRLLAYIYVDGKSLQEELLKRGLARVAYVYEPNVKYESKFRRIQKEAQRDKSGIWQWDHYVQKNGFDSKQVTNSPPKTSNESSKIVRFIASNNGDVYHPSNCFAINDIKPNNRIYFASEKDAISSGRKRSKIEQCWTE